MRAAPLQSKPKCHASHPVAGRLALVVAGIVVGAIIAEITVAVIRPQPVLRRLLRDTPAMYVPGTILPYALKPGFAGRFRHDEFDTWISITQEGFRGHYPPRGTSHRVIVVGDSFTFGHGVNDKEAYPAVLNQALKVDVINAGFASGWSPDMYYAWLVERGRDVGTATVLIGFFLGNDIDGHSNVLWDAVDDRQLPVKLSDAESHVVRGHWQPRLTPTGYRYPLLRESHLFHLLGTAFRQFEMLWRARSRSRPSIFDPDISPVADQIETTKRVFAGIKALCDERSIRLGVIMIPTLAQARDQASDRVNHVFAQHFVSLGVPFVDLLPVMRGRSDFYYPVDQHWNAAGHQQAAREIARWMIKEQLLTGSHSS